MGYGELIVILCIILILFGGKRLPELAKSLGIGIREFKKALNGEHDEREKEKVLIEKEKESDEEKK